MEIGLFIASIIIALIYILKPITKFDEKNFKDKNNWRNGF
tara:strand:+ start:768 stop:887 length:120 start_codon:yes stop_codon:yes gene_type:complete